MNVFPWNRMRFQGFFWAEPGFSPKSHGIFICSSPKASTITLSRDVGFLPALMIWDLLLLIWNLYPSYWDFSGLNPSLVWEYYSVSAPRALHSLPAMTASLPFIAVSSFCDEGIFCKNTKNAGAHRLMRQCTSVLFCKYHIAFEQTGFTSKARMYKNETSVPLWSRCFHFCSQEKKTDWEISSWGIGKNQPI